MDPDLADTEALRRRIRSLESQAAALMDENLHLYRQVGALRKILRDASERYRQLCGEEDYL